MALYLFGSAASGTFEPGLSDVDTVAVLSSGPTDEDVSALAQFHEGLVRDLPEWDDRVEVVYLSAAALANFRGGSEPAARVSPGEPFHRIEVDSSWVMDWYPVRESGLAIHGPPPATFIPPISHREFVEAVRAGICEWPKRIGGHPTAGTQAYAVLTMCRGLRLCQTGEHVSKREAARWAASQMPDFATLIENALVWRERSRAAGVTDASTTEGETRRFILAVAATVC